MFARPVQVNAVWLDVPFSIFVAAVNVAYVLVAVADVSYLLIPAMV